MLAIMETYIKDKVFVAWADEVSPGCPSLVSSSSSDIVQQQDDPDDASDSSSDCSTVTGLSDTPEGISGETRLLGQVGVMPVQAGGASLRGNNDSSPRRNVASSRGRILNAFHMAAECFDA